MQPAPIGAVEWSELGSMLFAMWMVVIFIVLFAANMIVGHNLLPSFIASGHVPQMWQKVRLFFYAAAVACFAIAVFFFVSVVQQAAVLEKIWPDYWI